MRWRGFCMPTRVSLWAALRDIGYDGDCSIEAYAPEEQRAEQV